MFEVGKKVICIKNSNSGLAKKGDVYVLIGIKKTCCSICLDIGKAIPIGKCQDFQTCAICKSDFKTDGTRWFLSSLFAPYDDSLSELTAEDILEEIATLTY